MIAKIAELVNLGMAKIQSIELPLSSKNSNSVDVLRLDKIHSIISGNKWFKLKHTLEEAISQRKTKIVTVGGAYSNHILATACACKKLGLESIAFIRGEQPRNLSCTLTAALLHGMKLEFVPRSLFGNKKELYDLIQNKIEDGYLVEEGGMNEKGICGAEEILELVTLHKYHYFCCAVGTGTTMAGIVRRSTSFQQVIGISSLKVGPSKNELNDFLLASVGGKNNFELINDYHFGGYAKYTGQLIAFMNELFATTGVPTDFVYTGKLFYAVSDLVKKSYFKPGSSILIIHSGGLQGNCSLPKDTLLF